LLSGRSSPTFRTHLLLASSERWSPCLWRHCAS
jgi:hypothetical protein